MTDLQVCDVRKGSNSRSKLSCFCIVEILELIDVRFSAGVLEELVSSGRLAGSITGGRQDKALYVPDIYTKSQQEYVDNFLQQNGYLGQCATMLQNMPQHDPVWVSATIK